MRVDRLSKDTQKTLRWGSHVPVCEAVLDTFGLNSVVELGAGLNSTPLFFARAERVVSIESDAEWIDRLREKVAENESRKIIHYPVPKGVGLGTYREQLPAGELERATEFYLSHVPDEIGLLFVDGFAGYRRQAVLDLYRRASVVVWHDAEPKYDHQYGYSSMTFDAGWRRMTDRTWPAHTGILLCPGLADQTGDLIEALRHSTARYADRFGVDQGLQVEFG